MKAFIHVNILSLALLAGLPGCITGCKAQQTYGGRFLSLEKTIKLPGVSGRIDHLSADKAHKMVYMAALGNNTFEAIDLAKGKVAHSIKELDEPQGVVYLPETNAVFVANGGNGLCTFYDAKTYRPQAKVDLKADADDVRHTPEDQTIYVGYGSGGIAMIDEASGKTTGTIPLPGHPEGFQVDPQTKKIWVNVPDAHIIAVLDVRNRKMIAQWKISSPSAYFPMAYDRERCHLYIGCRRPSRLLVLDSETGKKIAELPCVGDADDLYYDSASRRVLVSGGAGYIDIFKQQDADNYAQIAHIPSATGARTSLWVPEWRELILAVPAHNGQDAKLLVYKMNE